MAFIFIRHGQTPWNVERRFQGKSDIALNEVGIQQAHDSAVVLKDYQIACIYASPLQRAYHTAKIIKEDCDFPCEMLCDERLSERSFGSLEGNVCPPEVNLWNGSKLPYDDAETVEVFFERVQGFIEEYRELAKQQDILIVAHGGVYLAFHDYFIGFEPGEDRKKNIIANCKAVRFEVKD